MGKRRKCGPCLTPAWGPWRRAKGQPVPGTHLSWDLGSDADCPAQCRAIVGGCQDSLGIVAMCCGSVAKLYLTLCDPMDCRTPGLPVNHQLPELTQTHVHRVSDAIQPSHPLSPPSPPALNLFQHQGLFQGISSSHQVAKVLELWPQHHSFQ